MPCKHAELMRIYAKQAAEMDEPWELWEWKMNVDKHWKKLFIHPVWDKHTEYRQIPKTIRIGKTDVPEPMRVKPKCDSYYWCIDPDRKNGVSKHVWEDDSADNCRLSKGLCHLTSENCIAHAKALFSFTEVE